MEPLAKNDRATPIDLSAHSSGVREEISRSCTINIDLGLHTRPTVLLMKLAKYFVRPEDGERVEFSVNGHSAEPRLGFFSMLGLAAGKGCVLHTTLQGVEPERATKFLDAVESIVGHTCPEVAIYYDDAAELFKLEAGVVRALQRAIFDAKPE